jgi:ankyrin repeat protein
MGKGLELFLVAEEGRGNLVEVEEAIVQAVDLNAYVQTSSDGDQFTLLHFAVLNEHLDSVQRLVQTGAVEVNKRTARTGRTALFIAAEHGEYSC